VALTETVKHTNRDIKIDASDANLRFILASALHELAILHSLNDAASAEAKAELEDSLAGAEALVKSFSRTASFSRKLAEILTTEARLALTRNETDAAGASAERAIEILDELDGSAEGIPTYQPHLAAACLIAGEVKLAQGNRTEARAALLRARDSLRKARAVNATSPQLMKQAEKVNSLLSAMGN
jgi:hypothetical protein